MILSCMIRYLFRQCDKCPICLDDMSSPVYLYPCRHSVDSACLRKWLNQTTNNDCIICRQRIDWIISSRHVYNIHRFRRRFEDVLYMARYCTIDIHNRIECISFHSPSELGMRLWIHLCNLFLNHHLIKNHVHSIYNQIMYDPGLLMMKHPLPFGYYILHHNKSI